MKLICKPNVAASSRGITILEKGQTKEALQEALAKAKETSFDHKCLIEEFVEGEEFTVDMLGDSYGNVNCYGSSIQHHSLGIHVNMMMLHGTALRILALPVIRLLVCIVCSVIWRLS